MKKFIFIVSGYKNANCTAGMELVKDCDPEYTNPGMIKIRAGLFEAVILKMVFYNHNRKHKTHIRMKRNKDMEIIEELESEIKELQKEIERLKRRNKRFGL